MTDDEILLAIRSGNREEPVTILYKEFPKIERLIIKSGGTAEMAQEIFNDSLILVIEKIQKPDFNLTSKLTTYLYGVNRLLVKNELKKQNRYHDITWKNTLILTNKNLEYDAEYEQKLAAVELLLMKVSEKCRQIFKGFYFEKKSMQTIADELGYSSVNSAKTQKYKCIESAYKMSKNQH